MNLWKLTKKLCGCFGGGKKQEAPVHVLQFHYRGQVMVGVVTGCVGVRLTVQTQQGILAVSANQAASQLAFWSIVDELSPVSQRLTWEDGTPFFRS